MPFIVERVTGTVDRGIFQMAVLVDPAKPIDAVVGRPAVEPQAVLPVRRRVRHRAPPARARLGPAGDPLGRGFVVATSSLNIYANNCNDVVSAEAAMMTKELVVERYGELVYTMGNGGSAASMQQHLLPRTTRGCSTG